MCENLDIPLRERNTLLLAAGYAPFYPERSLDDPSLESALRTIETILEASAPNPALAIDRHWNMVIGSSALNPLIVGADPDLLKPPVNVMRLSLHPRGLASRIINLREWRRHLLHRLERQFRLSCDPEIGRLLDEVSLYQRDSDDADRRLGGGGNEIAVPLRLRTQAGVISFISTVTVFGTPAEISLSEVSIETFYPADDVSAGLLMKLSGN
ncbi:helix-turn-helix domain protein (plasmid) [Sinorhizobium sojae CCBAU 05684]|uniref:Helix-turn-helix domain protein n=1 Tax=Sinorhizobium sojae CCBAU 05684 TaxID=716928 RepID=A0A249PM31_9HYPH|nr:helix-turn-helix domain protein [Sinorhizobium sojae CCBAU 05684]